MLKAQLQLLSVLTGFTESAAEILKVKAVLLLMHYLTIFYIPLYSTVVIAEFSLCSVLIVLPVLLKMTIFHPSRKVAGPLKSDCIQLNMVLFKGKEKEAAQRENADLCIKKGLNTSVWKALLLFGNEA